MDSGESSDAPNTQTEPDKPLFKKPLLIGKVGKFPKKVVKNDIDLKTETVSERNSLETETEKIHEDKVSESKNEDIVEERQLLLPYKEPAWSGLPMLEGRHYKLEVLKLGSIIETIDLMKKPYWVFGRLNKCDILMTHPSISRYHAILQYRSEESDDEPKGFYLYDLSSTYGTFLNKNKLKPRTYIKMYVGHLLRLGLSTRSYILTGPENDTEEESALTITEMKQRREAELIRRKEAEEEAIRKQEEEKETMQKKLEERGIDWGLGEDADEDTDLTENPFAQTTNEELYLDDPKKALRGFMEREGYDLEYDCTEQGIGQFLCKVELPLDDDNGRPIVAEVLHKGKKKGAVIQCALEACRILDRYGLLRQATHESRKRKAKNWEENDFYDSDEDTFLDRTGTIEKKRESRMKTKVPAKSETYQSLLEKEAALRKEINNIENLLQTSGKCSSVAGSSTDEDSLDNYMKELKQMKLDKQATGKLKSDLSKLKQDLANVVKLANIAKPTDLPTLIHEKQKNFTTNKPQRNKLPIFGKRLKVKVQMPERKESINTKIDENEEDEEDREDMEMAPEESVDDAKLNVQDRPKLGNVTSEAQTLQINSKSVDFSRDSETVQENTLSSMAKETNRIHQNDEPKECEDSIFDDTYSELDSEKKKKKNQRRIQHRQEKAEIEKQKGYEEDAAKEDYNMWVPPAGQTGDGRTSLNDKYGY
ncbi:hypothetical protein AMK59_6439 [Oryctes borbonicus]|uniref:FHA domain-containing protein n=1 Tax=Oryctes borbonicus TaxID=1629725 RepID=A0A0T6AY20_9SCAR|nr:hypothetical protein AMK59_6439 [Oryctes borbonicus]